MFGLFKKEQAQNGNELIEEVQYTVEDFNQVMSKLKSILFHNLDMPYFNEKHQVELAKAVLGIMNLRSELENGDKIPGKISNSTDFSELEKNVLLELLQQKEEQRKLGNIGTEGYQKLVEQYKKANDREALRLLSKIAFKRNDAMGCWEIYFESLGITITSELSTRSCDDRYLTIVNQYSKNYKLPTEAEMLSLARVLPGGTIYDKHKTLVAILSLDSPANGSIRIDGGKAIYIFDGGLKVDGNKTEFIGKLVTKQSGREIIALGSCVLVKR